MAQPLITEALERMRATIQGAALRVRHAAGAASGNFLHIVKSALRAMVYDALIQACSQKIQSAVDSTLGSAFLKSN